MPKEIIEASALARRAQAGVGPSRRRRPPNVPDGVVADVLNRASTREHIRRAPSLPPIRILLAHQEPILLMGLQSVFGVARNCEIVGTATSTEQVVQQLRALQPDIVVLEADLPGASEIVAHELNGAVVIFGSNANPALVVAAIEAGARGYLLKRSDPALLVVAVETVAGGGVFLDETLVTTVREWFRAGQPGSDLLERLTQQEQRILRLVAAGKTNRAIATEIGLSEYTVKTYVSAALRKLQLNSRAEAAAFVTRHDSARL